jgi:acyl-CoA dehydrogenase
MSEGNDLRSLLDQVARERWDNTSPSAPTNEWDRAAAQLWNELEKLGLTLVGASESVGGSGGSVAHSAEVAKTVGRHALPLPIAETAMVASWLLDVSGLRIPLGPLTVAGAGRRDTVTATIDGSSLRLNGVAQDVPWASASNYILTISEISEQMVIALVEPPRVKVVDGFNLAGEPRQQVHFDTVVGEGHYAMLPAPIDIAAIRRRAALCRSAQLLGALEETRDLTLAFVQEREQFGRPIIGFQAVAQAVATLAADVALARVSVAVAVESAESGATAGELECAAAKVMTSRAARLVGAAAHQLHGAIGITAEYPLHRLTRRLWAWQDEEGSEDEWSAMLGSMLSQTSEAWPVLSAVAPQALA